MENDRRYHQQNNLKILILTASILTLAACSSGGLPSDVTSPSAQASATATPLSLSTSGLTSVFVNGTLQLFVFGGTTPYQFTTTGGSVSSLYAYTAPATAGSYQVTVTDAVGAQAFVTVTVADNSATTTTTDTTTTDTTQTTTTTTVATTPPVKVVWRFFNGVTGIHSFSDNQLDSQGGAIEGPVYLVLVNAQPGSAPLFRCTLPLGNGLNGFFESLDPGCEGQVVTAVYQLGYVYTSQITTGAAQPLYRARLAYQLGQQPMLDHLDIPGNPSLPTPGWQFDSGLYGWVPTQ